MAHRPSVVEASAGHDPPLRSDESLLLLPTEFTVQLRQEGFASALEHRLLTWN